jgi:ABC-type molybdate transport system substrate-binding protein
LIATRQADLGLYLVSEVQDIKGISVMGLLLPPTMQSYVVYATAIPAANQAPEPALVFIRFLTAPDKAERWRRAGFELSREP